MLLFSHFHLPPALCNHVVATRLTSPSLTLCLNLRVHFLDKSEGTGTCGDTLEESDTDNKSLCGNILEESNIDDDNLDPPDNTKSSATSRKKGSFNWDLEKGRFTLK